MIERTQNKTKKNDAESLVKEKLLKTFLTWERKDMQTKDTQRILNKINPKRVTLRHIMIKWV